MSEDVELSIEGEVALIRLRRPEPGNLLRGSTFETLRKMGLKLADSPPRFVVLHGEGPDFCAGLDPHLDDPLYTLFDPVVRSKDAYRAQEFVSRIRGTLDVISRLSCPVIVAIEGRCHGAGLELALIGDLRVASTEATFRIADTRVGLITGLGGLTRLSLLVGPSRTTDLILSGAEVGAAEARQLGLVNRTCPPGAALTTALDLVHEMRRGTHGARLQALLALRQIHHQRAADLVQHESQAAARTWIAGEWQTLMAHKEPGPR